MAETSALFWRSIPRATAAYAQRADERESHTDSILLAASARLRRPLASDLRRARAVADIVEREQAAMDRLSAQALRAAADDLRAGFLERGFAPELTGRAFALVRTAAQREIGLRHFPVQLMGGQVMLEGMLAEMETGEGKTLTATLPAAAAALAGLPVHMVTVNDYLAQRDGEWMRPVFAALGLTVGIVQHGQQPAERRAAYAADIAYCTNKDLGFDYLRDTLTLASRSGRDRLLLEKMLGRGDRLGRLLLRGLYFALVDEADSVLIDEARTPLIISGVADAADADTYRSALDIARQLEANIDYRIDPRERSVLLTGQGKTRIKQLCGALAGAWRSARGREELVQQALAALHLYQSDLHYLLREGKVQIVDEYTGRVLADRSWERGLQQLIEVKESGEVTGRRTTLARITYQRLFRRYLRVAGMTGTAMEMAPELDAVYALKVVRIPTNKPVQRRDHGVRLYASAALKWAAVTGAIVRARSQGRPVLIGTRSVAASEQLSAELAGSGIDHVVLNARQDSVESDVIARAGQPGVVTVATNMAGRGTDIQLAPGVAAKGGLHVILTEYHESARIDRQLFGRCGRQGDSGSYEAVVCLEDDVFRRYGGGVQRMLSARYAGQEAPLPRTAAAALKWTAQRCAEQANSRARRATLESDRKLDTALAFAGPAE